MGVSKEDIEELRYWNGDELGELHLTTDGRWVKKADSMEGVENSPNLEPTEIGRHSHRMIGHTGCIRFRSVAATTYDRAELRPTLTATDRTRCLGGT